MKIKPFPRCKKYLIYEDGRIFSLHCYRFLKPDKCKGYHRIVLNGKRYQWHRVVCITYHGNPPKNKPYVNHKDKNKINNHANNVEWCDQLYNMRHAYSSGRNIKNTGELNKGGGKLTNKDVTLIKLLIKSGRFSQRTIGKLFKVAQTTICEINKRKKWKYHK